MFGYAPEEWMAGKAVAGAACTPTTGRGSSPPTSASRPTAGRSTRSTGCSPRTGRWSGCTRRPCSCGTRRASRSSCRASSGRHRAEAVLEERLHHQAFHDPLTGLPNRRLFVDRLGQALDRTRRQGTEGGRAVHGPRRLQGRQRLPRPRGRGPAPHGRGPAPRALPAPGGHPGPLRRRRVRRAPRGHRRPGGGRPGGRADHGGASEAVRAGGQAAVRRRQHRHLPGRRPDPRPRGPPQGRRHGDVPGQGRAARATRCSTRPCTSGR